MAWGEADIALQGPKSPPFNAVLTLTFTLAGWLEFNAICPSAWFEPRSKRPRKYPLAALALPALKFTAYTSFTNPLELWPPVYHKVPREMAEPPFTLPAGRLCEAVAQPVSPPPLPKVPRLIPAE